MDKYKFGEFIYTQRKKQGLTQDELGRKLRVTNKAVSKWETGETLPDIQLIPELASVLNVTIDELLTQEKPSVEKVMVDRKKGVRIFLWIMSSILFLITTLLAINLIKITEDEVVTNENAKEYFEIIPCENFVIEGYGVSIYGKLRTKEEILDPTLVLEFTIQYYYVNSDNELSEILYTDRIISYDSLTEDFSIVLSPKSQIDNFKSFYRINITYEIVESSGKVVK